MLFATYQITDDLRPLRAEQLLSAAMAAFGGCTVSRGITGEEGASGAALGEPATRALAQAPLQLDILPGRFAGEDLVEAEVELVLLGHGSQVAIGLLILGQREEDDLIRLAGLVPHHGDEGAGDLRTNVALPLLQKRLELAFLARLERGAGGRAEMGSSFSDIPGSGR